MRPRLLILLVWALVVAACGGGDQNPAAEDDEPSVPVTGEAGDSGDAAATGDGSGEVPEEATPLADAETDEAGGGVADDGGSCALTTPDAVAAAFGASSAAAEPATTGSGEPTCRYLLADDGLIPRLFVRLRGSSNEWDPLVLAAQAPPILGVHVYEEVPGIGDAAFYHRTSEAVTFAVRLGPDIFTIAFSMRDVTPETGRELDLALTELAKVIAGS